MGKIHKVRVTGLDKGTTYRYRIYSKEVMVQSDHYIQYGRVAASVVYGREPLRFTTPNQSIKEFSFAVINDIHERSDLLDRLLAPLLPQKPDFIFFNGDMVTDLRSQQQMLDGFLHRSVEMFASETPFFFARGNHETRGTFSQEFINYFPTPTGQPYYSFRWGPAFFVVLDGGEDKPDSDVEYFGLAAFDQYRHEQAAWLKETLASEEFKQAPVKIAVMHIPPVRSTWYGLTEVKKLFIPLLNDAGIDIMLSGHLHRHFYLDGKEEDCHFPILINSNEEALFIRVNENRIGIEVTDDKGKRIKEFVITP
ncbi:MAG: metallophosphoesterase family protein [Tannerellaceae bacterium]|nr:metallophosphoesterase family protein [Tannerellaceae bacterium]